MKSSYWMCRSVSPSTPMPEAAVGMSARTRSVQLPPVDTGETWPLLYRKIKNKENKSEGKIVLDSLRSGEAWERSTGPHTTE